jgi:hypothetical protein
LVDSAELLEFSVETGQDLLIEAQGDYPLATEVTSEFYFTQKLSRSY